MPANVYRGAVATYNRLGARVFLVPDSYDSLLSNAGMGASVKARSSSGREARIRDGISGSGRSGSGGASNGSSSFNAKRPVEGLDPAVQDVLEEYQDWEDAELEAVGTEYPAASSTPSRGTEAA